jgi:hypothetical protein
MLSNLVPDVSHPRWGRPAASFFSLAGQGGLLRITLINTAPGSPQKEVPYWGSDVHRIFGVWGHFAPIFVTLSIHALLTKKQQCALLWYPQ